MQESVAYIPLSKSKTPLSEEQIQALPDGQHAIGGVSGLRVYKNGNEVRGYFLQVECNGKKYRQDYPINMRLSDIWRQAYRDRINFRNIIKNDALDKQKKKESQPIEKPVKAVKPKPVKVEDDFQLEPTKSCTSCVEESSHFSNFDRLIINYIFGKEIQESANDPICKNVLEGLFEKIIRVIY